MPYKIDDRDYAAALDQAKAQAERTIAAREYARSNFKRGDELVKTGFLAKDNYDQRVRSARQHAWPERSRRRAGQRHGPDRRDQPRLHRDPSPFSGRRGRNRAPVGTLVGGSGLTLNTLVQLDPIYVTFNPSEGDTYHHGYFALGGSGFCSASRSTQCALRILRHNQDPLAIDVAFRGRIPG